MMQERFTPDELRERFSYDPTTGALRWKPRPSEGYGARWNKRWAGKVAGTRCSNGYLKVNTYRGPIHVHRIAWAIHHGEWPSAFIDHINGDRADNRIDNLRSVEKVLNQRNRRIPSNNTSGFLGVAQVNDRWHARIKTGDVTRFLGSFDTSEEAQAARRRADAEMGFHPNHGRAG